MAFFSKPQSSAVKIVDPNSQDELRPHRKDTVQRQCRNVMIYGYCKFQDKGCTYYHPPTESTPPATTTTTTTPTTTTTTSATTSTSASGTTPRLDSTLSAQAINAPVFVPKSVGTPVPATPPPAKPPPGQQQQAIASPTSPSPTLLPASALEFTPSSASFQSPEAYDAYPFSAGDTSVGSVMDQMQNQLDTLFYDESQQYNPYQSEYDASATYSYPPAPIFLRQPLNYHLYTPSIPVPFINSTSNSHFVPPSNELRQNLQSRSETTRGEAPIGMDLPEELQGYHSLVPLENISGSPTERRKFLNWYSVVYRAVRLSDGLPYTLRRVENYRLTQQSAFAAIETWSKIRHPNIVFVHEAFTTRAFNDNSLAVCYTYHPNARTLFDVHLKAKVAALQNQAQAQAQASQQLGGLTSQHGLGLGHGQAQRLMFSPFGTTTTGATTMDSAGGEPMIPERIVWTYVVQIASAIKQVHEVGLAVRTVDATKILVTGQNRVRIGSCGLIDVLMHDTPQDLALLQQEDLLMFGRLLYALCCTTLAVVTNGASFQKSLDTIGRQYSADLKNVIVFLMSKGGGIGGIGGGGIGVQRSIDPLLDMVRGKVLIDLNDALMGMDRLENELLSELENARLVRLLCKFGFINERPEFARDPRWSETGDRYIIKLFRDYVFHQVDEHGNPVINLSHVLTCLNKLDAGTDEKIMLMARDEQSCLVVSYKDVKQCIESAFTDLARSSSKKQGTVTGYR